MSNNQQAANYKAGLIPFALVSMLGALLVLGCSKPSADDRAALIADGQAEIERHEDDPILEPVDVSGFAFTALSVNGASIPGNNQMPLGNNPLHQEAPTTYTYHYDYVEGEVEHHETLDAIAARYIEVGAELVDPPSPARRRLRAQSMGDDLEIELRYLSSATTGADPQAVVTIKIVR